MNTPNKLTIARMIIVPFLVIFLLTGWGGEANRYISLTLFVVASVTDVYKRQDIMCFFRSDLMHSVFLPRTMQ